jgi:di/tricarboxylate transporter
VKPEFVVLALILIGALYCFWTQRLRTDITALLVMLTLALPWPRMDGKWSAILSPQEAFSGFGTVAVIMVTAMFMFGAAMVRTATAEMIGGRLFRACAHNELLLQVAVMSVATVFSMFINETTIVLVFMPVVLTVCKERNLSPSRYLLCAAYGAALGGQWTLIGTRSNIIASDILRQRTGLGIGFFDFTPVAAPVFVGCAIYFFLVGRRFLPKAEIQSLEQELGKEYLTEVMVTPQSNTVGLTLDQLDWAKRQDVTIVGVIREGERMPPNGWMRLHPGDALIMQGAVPTIGSLLKSPDFQFMEEVKIGGRPFAAWISLRWKRCSLPIPDTQAALCNKPISVAITVSVCWAFRGMARQSRSGLLPRDWSTVIRYFYSATTQTWSAWNAIRI